MSIETIQLWHERARPNPTDKDFNVQLGCHFEEIAEMLSVISPSDEQGYRDQAVIDAEEAVTILAGLLKSGQLDVSFLLDRKAFLDSIADQVVTAVGVGHCARMKTAEAIDRVNASNWSKFVDGQPVFNEQGKIAKGPDYAPPNLEGLYR